MYFRIISRKSKNNFKIVFNKRFLISILCLIVLISSKINLYASVGKLVSALDQNVWDESEWISVTDAPIITSKVYNYHFSQRAADGANWFITKLSNDQSVLSAKWMTTGLGVYDIFINGKLIGDEVLKPGYTNPYKTKYSFTYDITDSFNSEKGDENVLSAQVTPGWWADKILTPDGHDGMIGKKCAFRGVLEVTYSNGEKVFYGTNTEDWRAGIAGKVKHSAIFDGLVFDASEEEGFNLYDSFKEPEINNEFDGMIIPTNGAEVYFRYDLTLNPLNAYIYTDTIDVRTGYYGKVNVTNVFSPNEIIKLEKGETLIIDFGQNCAAVPYFKFKAKADTKLRCYPGEILNDNDGSISRGMDGPEGSLHRANLRTPSLGMFIEYTFDDGEDFIEFLPRSTFFGYRYISITVSEQVIFERINSIPISSIIKETGLIKTGDASVNQLINNTIWSQRSNYLSIPSDCPQRNERLGYTADTQIFAETGSFFADTKKFLNKWLRDLRDSQWESGAYTQTAPMGMFGNVGMRFGWADAGILVPFTIWKQYGEIDVIRDNWESMNRFIDHVSETKYDHDLLSHENMNYQNADWLSFEQFEVYKGLHKESNGQVKDAAKDYWNYLSASYWLMDAKCMYEMSKVLGENPEKYQELINDAYSHLRNFFYDDGSFKNEQLNEMQTPLLFALKNDIFTGKTKEGIIRRLRSNFEENGNTLQTGFLGTSILMNTLTDNGMVDIAYDLLFQRNNPSWLYSIDNGATTIWEKWDSYTIENGLANMGMNSFNHYAYGCVCEWLFKNCAGIAADINDPGFHHIIMRPIPDERLGFVEAVYQTKYGNIKSKWIYDGDLFQWNFSIPNECTASIFVPGSDISEEYSAGEYTLSCTYNPSKTPEIIRDNDYKIDHNIIYFNDSVAEIYILDTSGRVLIYNNQNHIDISHLSRGIYFIKDGVYTHKIFR